MKIAKYIKTRIQALFYEKGIIIQKKTPLNSEEKLLSFLLGEHQIDLVLDIGANKGQFAMELLKSGFAGNVVSFEPLPETFKELQANAKKYPRWKVENLAVGNQTGSITINVSANTESSSVLAMLDRHSDLAPESKYVKSLSVPIITLDKYVANEMLICKNVFLKIDVQGFEESVLIGAATTLQNVKLLQLEISFTPLYQNSTVYYTMMEKIEKMGFSFFSLQPAFTDYKTGQIFQIDAIYIKQQQD